MIDVFLSRPTWIDEPYRRGLQGFLALLSAHQLRPRTIGATDYPSRGPLDEVIRLLGQCQGAIILGYPQIVLQSGRIKNVSIEESVFLPTEWNHIEASLAYARGMPLLLIHHVGVIRGVFDRGAINSYVYAKNLEDPDWASSPEIAGALSNWKEDVVSAPPAERKVETTNPGAVAGIEVEPEMVAILKILGEGPPKDVDAGILARHFQMNEQKMIHYLERLTGADFLWQRHNWRTGATWLLAPKGREYLVERGLI